MIPLPPTIEAGPVHLRRLTIGDAWVLRQAIAASREHLRPFLPFASSDPDDLKFRTRWIIETNQSFDAGRSYNYGVLAGSELVGVGTIDPRGPEAASIGYWIHVDHTRKGYATAAAIALRDTAVQAGFTTVLLRHDKANTASEAVARRAGFTFMHAEAHSIDAPGQTGVTLVWACEQHAGRLVPRSETSARRATL